MNAAYREFLRDALGDWLAVRGVDFEEMADRVEEVLADRPGAEPDPYRYAAAEGTHVAVAFGRSSLEAVLDPDEVAKLELMGDLTGVDYVDSVLAEWCREFGETYGASGVQDIETDSLLAARAALGVGTAQVEAFFEPWHKEPSAER